MQFSHRTLEICEKNYKKNCGGCELRPECVAKTKPGKDGIDEWVKAVNAKAEASHD